MAQCTAAPSRQCPNAEAYCRRVMAAAGCAPEWCTEGAALAEKESVSVVFYQEEPSRRALQAAVQEFVPAETLSGLRYKGTVSYQHGRDVDVRRVTEVRYTVFGGRPLPAGVMEQAVLLLEALTVVDAFRTKAGVSGCDGCTDVVTQSCHNFVLEGPKVKPTGENQCAAYAALPDPDTPVAVHFDNWNAKLIGCSNLMDRKDARCPCLLGLVRCTAASGCKEGEAYCRKFMSGAECDPDWCAPAPLPDVPRKASVVFTLEDGENGRKVQPALWKHWALPMVPFTWVTMRLQTGVRYGIRGRVVVATLQAPAGALWAPENAAGSLRGYLMTEMATNASFRQDGGVKGWTTPGDVNCYNHLYEPYPATLQRNTDTCADYASYPRPGVASVDVTKQAMCVEEALMRGATQPTTCLCYVKMTRCTHGSGCDEGAAYCRRVLQDAGCNPDWCTAEDRPEALEVSLAYTVTADANTLSIRGTANSIMHAHGVIPSTAMTVSFSTDAAGARVATLTVVLGTLGREVPDVDGFAEHVAAQLHDLPKNSAFASQGGVLAVVEGSGSVPAATPVPGWVRPATQPPTPLGPNPDVEPTDTDPADTTSTEPAGTNPPTPNQVTPPTPSPLVRNPSTPSPATPFVPTPTVQTSPEESKGSSSNTGMVVGLAVGGVVIVVAAVAFGWWYMSRGPAAKPMEIDVGSHGQPSPSYPSQRVAHGGHPLKTLASN
eukprot:TRINITY_DN455_c0_g1_i2.p1 TRINITY_DN455_c0_g1~~TRINITY_DN455_c0_g1_i2.p1  ORF type:complete len:813 (+),score=213.82 TRINITY_DN455_c0_g1_i2:290-2440(+)